jgi:hypothetical protein
MLRALLEFVFPPQKEEQGIFRCDPERTVTIDKEGAGRVTRISPIGFDELPVRAIESAEPTN